MCQTKIGVRSELTLDQDACCAEMHAGPKRIVSALQRHLTAQDGYATSGQHCKTRKTSEPSQACTVRLLKGCKVHMQL
eukprot:5625978-Karenia_brevis.AAC.1